MPSAAQAQVFARAHKLRGIAHACGNYWSIVCVCVCVGVLLCVTGLEMILSCYIVDFYCLIVGSFLS